MGSWVSASQQDLDYFLSPQQESSHSQASITTESRLLLNRTIRGWTEVHGVAFL